MGHNHLITSDDYHRFVLEIRLIDSNFLALADCSQEKFCAFHSNIPIVDCCYRKIGCSSISNSQLTVIDKANDWQLSRNFRLITWKAFTTRVSFEGSHDINGTSNGTPIFFFLTFSSKVTFKCSLWWGVPFKVHPL